MQTETAEAAEKGQVPEVDMGAFRSSRNLGLKGHAKPAKPPKGPPAGSHFGKERKRPVPPKRGNNEEN